MTSTSFWRWSKWLKSERAEHLPIELTVGTWDRFIEYQAKMRKPRKKEAEERQRQIAQTIRYISWGLITDISLGGLSLLYFFPEFLRGLK